MTEIFNKSPESVISRLNPSLSMKILLENSSQSGNDTVNRRNEQFTFVERAVRSLCNVFPDLPQYLPHLELFLEKRPIVGVAKPEWEEFTEVLSCEQGRTMVCVDFDGTLAAYSDGQVMAVEYVIEAATEMLDKGHLFMVNSGRPVKELIDAFKASDASECLLSRIEFVGEYGAVSQGPSTGGVEQLRPDLEKFVPIGERIIQDIKFRVEADDNLKGYLAQTDDDGHPLITIQLKTLGGSIHRYYLLEQHKKKFSQEEAEEKLRTIDDRLFLHIRAALEEKYEAYQSFCTTGQMNITGINIVLAKNKDIEVSKGTAIDILLNSQEVKRGLVFGDEIADLDMRKSFQDRMISEFAIKKKIAVNDQVLEKKNRLSDNQDTKKRIEMLKKMLSALEHEAFVGVEHGEGSGKKRVPEIENDSTILVSNPENAGKLLLYIAKNIVNLRKDAS